MRKTRWHSWSSGEIAKGCRMCVEGSKLVLFVTGLCSRQCWFCPLSEQKKNRDVVFANEWKTSSIKDIIREAELCESKGAGITGGDPFLRIARAVRFIKALKRRFGKKFHIHLYAPLDHITEKSLKQLFTAGLDEIRIHPDFISEKNWHRIDSIKKFSWDVGVEIPVIPGMENEARALIGFFLPKISFLNLNELEQSDTNADAMEKRNFAVRSMVDNSVVGSRELGLKLMKSYENSGTPIHFCTTKLKDAVQLANRIRRRAKNIAGKFDRITSEGMLKRGAVYLEDLKPSFGYRKMLESIPKEKKRRFAAKLRGVMSLLSKKYRIPKSLIAVDLLKLRLLTSEKFAKKINEPGLATALVEEYPTWDQTELSVTFL